MSRGITRHILVREVWPARVPSVSPVTDMVMRVNTFLIEGASTAGSEIVKIIPHTLSVKYGGGGPLLQGFARRRIS